MEVNKYEDIMGVVVTEDIVEGRMVVLTSHAFSHNYGSREDLPGVKLPANTTEAARARYCVAFPVDNTQPPIYQPYPAYTSNMRYGFNEATNVPFTADVYMTAPSMLVGQTIPSGTLALAFGAGAVITVPSGAYVYTTTLVPGAFLDVSDTTSHTTDTGKLRYSADASFAEVLEVDDDLNLTFKILY